MIQRIGSHPHGLGVAVCLAWLAAATGLRADAGPLPADPAFAPGNMAFAPGNMAFAPGNMAFAPGNMAFAPGERLTFELRWLVVPAGRAVLEVGPITRIDGRAAWHFRLTVRSNAVIDRIYKVRDRIDAYTDLNMTRSVHYRKKQHEGSTRRDVALFFDWRRQQVRYRTPTELRDPVDVKPGTFDPLSVFYYARGCDLERAEPLQRPVTDGKKCVMGIGRVVRRETIRLSSGVAYDTFLIEPELKDIGGVFRKSPNAKIQVWVTADARRIPVMPKSRVVVGSFVGELASAEGLIATPTPH